MSAASPAAAGGFGEAGTGILFGAYLFVWRVGLLVKDGYDG